MMNVLFCKNSFAGPISGADEIVVTYAVELKAAGYSSSVLLVHPPADDDPLAARLRAAGVPLSSLASSKFSTSLAAGRKLAISAMRVFSPAGRMIRTNSRTLVFDLLQRYHDACCEHMTRHRPDVVHVLTPDPGAVMLIRAAHTVGVPVVYQEVGIPFDPPGFEEVYERFVSVLPLCAEVAILSPRLAREMGRLLPQLRPPQVLPIMSQDATNGARGARPSSAPVRFGFAARLEHLKGPLQLVEGFRIAHLSQPSVELAIAGDGSQRRQIALTLRRLGLENRCHLAGTYTTLEERNRFMRDIDVFVLPSLTEGTPNAIIEAMAHAKPVIATSVGGIPDFVTEDVGILVPAGDPKALGAAMTRLANDAGLRKRMGRAAREKYERIFSPSVVLPLLSDFYRRVIDGDRATNNGKGQPTGESRHPWSHDAELVETYRLGV
jgi:glycosyltransferase involved in cell wall biosynthesis